MAENILNFTQESFMVNEDSQNPRNCDENHKSKELLDEQLGASWFSPPITSTQKVSFDLLDKDDSQDEWVSGNEAQNILVDLTADELDTVTSDEIAMQFTDPAYLLGLSPLQDQSNISETPPPKGVSQNWNNTDVTDYLFNSSKLIMTENSNNISTPIMKAPSKRLLASHDKSKSAKIKKPKIEGYSCKLNGAMYQVNSRDLDVLEAIERGLKVIQEKIHQNLRMCNVRSLCLQLTQIETVLDILNSDDHLELGMHVEAWDEMMILTKALFHDTQHEVQLCKNKRLEHDTSTDELTTSFSRSLNISGSKLAKQNSNQQLLTHNRRGKKTEKNRSSITPLVEIEQEHNETQIIGAPQKFNESIAEKPASKSLPNHSTETTASRGQPSKSTYKSLKKNRYAPATYKKGCQISNQQNVGLMETSTNNFPSLSGEVLNELFADDSTFNKDLSRSQTTLEITSTEPNMPLSENYLESLPNTFRSVLCANESMLPSQKNVQVNNAQLNAVRVCINSSQQIEDEIVILETNTKVTDYQDGSFIASLNSSVFRRKGRGSSKIVMMNFKLGPFVLKGVLSPGKNNMKMAINNRIYIASLANDGTIEMNGFSFPSIGNWIKSVEGKRFDKLSRIVQKTLEVQYNGKPLEEALEMREDSLLMENKETPLRNPDNIPQGTFSVNPIKNLLNDSPTEDEPAQKNAVPDNLSDMNFYGLQLVPDEMTRHIKTILLHTADEYFPICQCLEQYWSGKQPFPQHMLDEVDDW